VPVPAKANARGLADLDLAIRSETLLEVELMNLRTLSRLTVAAPALKELAVARCFGKNRPVAIISAPRLTNLDWGDEYNPISVHLGKMEHLRSLGTDYFLVYGDYAFIHNHFCLSLLQRVEGIQTLCLTLMYLRVSSLVALPGSNYAIFVLYHASLCIQGSYVTCWLRMVLGWLP